MHPLPHTRWWNHKGQTGPRAAAHATAWQRSQQHPPRSSTDKRVDAAPPSSSHSSSSHSSEPFLGPLQAVSIEGKGRGLIATRDVQLGECLVVCHPLAVVTGPQHEQPPLEALQDVLAANAVATPGVCEWLGLLCDGTSASTAALPPHLMQQQPTHQQQPEGPPAVADAQLLQRIQGIVKHNAYADAHDDLSLAAAGGHTPVSLVALYPEFSLFNHSCVPTCINLVLPGAPHAMVVRAARPIAAGAEATISYLGGPQLLPLPGRESSLASFGFVCRCERCTAEEDLPDALAALLDDIVSRTTQVLAPRLEAAAAAGDLPAVADVRQQAGALVRLLFAQFRRHLISPTMRQQLLASCFCCLQVCADADAALGDEAAAAASLRTCLQAAAAVTPGSDLHCILAAKLEALVRGGAGDTSSSDQRAAAWAACVEAHTARYGPLDEAGVRQLAGLNATLYA